jgi:hypothetical protein
MALLMASAQTRAVGQVSQMQGRFSNRLAGGASVATKLRANNKSESNDKACAVVLKNLPDKQNDARQGVPQRAIAIKCSGPRSAACRPVGRIAVEPDNAEVDAEIHADHAGIFAD